MSPPKKKKKKPFIKSFKKAASFQHLLLFFFYNFNCFLSIISIFIIWKYAEVSPILNMSFCNPMSHSTDLSLSSGV